MQATNIWNLYNLSSKKIAFLLFFAFFTINNLTAQERIRRHDDKKADNGYSYGIHLAMTQHNFRIERSGAFLNQSDIRAVEGLNEPGVSIGIIGALHPSERIEVRTLPAVNFNNELLLYTIEGLDKKALYEGSSVAFEIPLQLKYKSKPYNDFRMFLLTGGKYRTNFATDKSQDLTSQTVQLVKGDYMFELGAGAEIHFDFFTFAPTFTISQGFKNQRVRNDASDYTEILSGLYSRVYSIGFNIE